MHRSTRWVCLSAVLGLIAGCGGGDKGPPLAKVSGTVTYKGQPLAGATVLFVPAKKGRPAQGTTDANGKFTLTTNRPGDGAAVADHTIVVTKLGPPDGMTEQQYEEKQKSAGAGSLLPPPKSMVPAKFTTTASPLKVKVKEGTNEDVKVDLTD